MPRARAFLVLLALLLFPAPALPATDPLQETQEDLRRRLGELLDQRENLERTREQARRELLDLEAVLAASRAKRRELAEESRELDRRLAQTAELLARLDRESTESRARLGPRLRAWYLFGPEASEALLASAADFREALARSQAFTDLLTADQRRLTRLLAQKRELSALREGFAERQAEADSLADLLRQQAVELTRLLAQRQALLADLAGQESQLGDNIKALQEAQTRLAGAFALGRDPGGYPRAKGVLSARGNLSPPVEGELVGRAGPGERGVVLKARPGAPVRSPWWGKVAYAGRLAGSGQVVVVDHGDRVHTVLANLSGLAVEAGQEGGGAPWACGRRGETLRKWRRAFPTENLLLCCVGAWTVRALEDYLAVFF